MAAQQCRRNRWPRRLPPPGAGRAGWEARRASLQATRRTLRRAGRQMERRVPARCGPAAAFHRRPQRATGPHAAQAGRWRRRTCRLRRAQAAAKAAQRRRPAPTRPFQACGGRTAVAGPAQGRRRQRPACCAAPGHARAGHQQRPMVSASRGWRNQKCCGPLRPRQASTVPVWMRSPADRPVPGLATGRRLPRCQREGCSSHPPVARRFRLLSCSTRHHRWRPAPRLLRRPAFAVPAAPTPVAATWRLQPARPRRLQAPTGTARRPCQEQRRACAGPSPTAGTGAGQADVSARLPPTVSGQMALTRLGRPTWPSRRGWRGPVSHRTHCEPSVRPRRRAGPAEAETVAWARERGRGRAWPRQPLRLWQRTVQQPRHPCDLARV